MELFRAQPEISEIFLFIVSIKVGSENKELQINKVFEASVKISTVIDEIFEKR